MGIKGLSSFIAANSDTLLTQEKLHDTRLLINGNNLCYILYNTYKLDQKHGGNYDEFVKRIK